MNTYHTQYFVDFIRRDEHDLKHRLFRSSVERAMSWSRAWRAGARLSRAASRVRASSAFESPAALAAVSVAFMAYALWTYLWRARRIARREPSARYDDVAGPTALVVVLVVVSSVAAVAAVADAARARRRL